MTHYVLLVIFAVGFCHAQRDIFSNQDGFVFPGEAERPDKFPLNPANPFRTTTQRSVNPVTPDMDDINQCINNCPVTSEYNPVCGTDNVVYNNPGRLGCAANCQNMDIQIRRYGQCTGTIRG